MIAGSLADVVGRADRRFDGRGDLSSGREPVRMESASVAAFTTDGPAVSLAFVRADGAPVPLRRLPLRRSRSLRSRAIGGPWVEAYGRRPTHPYARLHDELGTAALAYAPIRHAGAVVGLLTVTSAHKRMPSRGSRRPSPPSSSSRGSPAPSSGPAISDLAETDHARDLISDLIQNAAFRPVFQPIVDLETGGHMGYEALTRFANGTAPDVVFADARRVGLEEELEMATLSASVAEATQLPRGAWVSLNVSPDLVTGANGRLAEILGRADRPVVLEVTEHVPVADYPMLRECVDRLGPEVRVAVDDAGAGIANFGHIVELRPAFVKLDIALVRRIDTDHTRQALVLGLLQFASESASQTIAEGVETEAELATLRRLGVPLGQGYLLARPAPASHWAKTAGKPTTKRTPHAERTAPTVKQTAPSVDLAGISSRRADSGIIRSRPAGGPRPRTRDR